MHLSPGSLLPWCPEIPGLQPVLDVHHPFPLSLHPPLPSLPQRPVHPVFPVLLAGSTVPHTGRGAVSAEEGVQDPQQLSGGGG